MGEGDGAGEGTPPDIGLDANVTYYFSFSEGTVYVYETQDAQADDYLLTLPVTDGTLRDGDYGDVLWDTKQLEVNWRGNADTDAEAAAVQQDKGKERQSLHPGDEDYAEPDSTEPTGFAQYRVAGGRCHLYADEQAVQPYESVDPEPGMQEHDYGSLTYYGDRYVFEKYGNAKQAEDDEYARRARLEQGHDAPPTADPSVPVVEPPVPVTEPSVPVTQMSRADFADFQRAQSAADRDSVYGRWGGDAGRFRQELEAAEQSGEKEFGDLCRAADSSATLEFTATDKWVLFGPLMDWGMREVLEIVALRGAVRFTRHHTRPNEITLERIQMGNFPAGDPKAPDAFARALGKGTDAALTRVEDRIKVLARTDLYPWRDGNKVIVRSSR